MPVMLEELWSDDIKVDVLSPLAILRAQEGGLARRTNGLLQAKVETTDAGDERHHTLNLVAPSLGYRERLLMASHRSDQIYPVILTAEAFDPDLYGTVNLNRITGRVGPILGLAHNQRRAATDQDFIDLVRQVLRSETVRSRIQSLIARINDENLPSMQANVPTNDADDSDDTDEAP